MHSGVQPSALPLLARGRALFRGVEGGGCRLEAQGATDGLCNRQRYHRHVIPVVPVVQSVFGYFLFDVNTDVNRRVQNDRRTNYRAPSLAGAPFTDEVKLVADIFFRT